MSLTRINNQSLTNVTSAGIPKATGEVLQVVRFSSAASGGNGANTDYGWDSLYAPSTGVTAKGTNSTWVVTTQHPMASRGAATSCDIWYKVGSSGTWYSLGEHGTAGGNGVGSYGMGTIWDTSSSDIWLGAAHHGSKTITNAIGDVLYFKSMYRRGGPGSDHESSGSSDAPHGRFTMFLTVMEIAG